MKKLIVSVLFVLCNISITLQAQTCNDNITANTPDSRFSINGDEVTDTQTGLIWQRCPLGQTGNECESGSAQRYSWSEALQAAQTKSKETGLSWRLPNIKELQSIVEKQCSTPAINLTIFPNVNGLAFYWSASPYVHLPWSAWTIYFNYGRSSNENKATGFYARLVRT